MSEKETQKNTNAENPEELHHLKLTSPKKKAAGWPAITSSVKHVFSEMGPSRGIKALNKLNQIDGYDCPGCAWPDPDDDRSILGEYCENGAKAIAEEATTKSLRADFFAKHSVQEMSEWDDYIIGKKGRLAEPLYLAQDADHYAPISWEAAFQKIGQKLKDLDTPDEAIFYTSGRTSNEAAFLYQLFVRMFGTNNMPDCSNMCHESSGVALGESLGIGKGSVKLEDFYEAEVILIIGQNPGTNHPRMLSALKKARQNGAFIASINPLKEAGTTAFVDPQSVTGLLGVKSELDTDHYGVKINGDMALFKAINHLLVQKDEAIDTEFIKNHTDGFDTYKSHLEKQDINRLAAMCGIEIEKIQILADKIANKSKIIACWAMGLTQHKNSVDTIKEVVNTLLLKGSIGKPGAGTCPVRGHSNVQGDRTMGIYEKPWKWLLDKLEENFGFNPPRKSGYDVVESIKAMHDGRAKLFFALGGNFLSATPDTQYTAEALRSTDMTVQVSTKLNRSHLVTGKEALILPTLGRSDRDLQEGIPQFVTCENSMGVVQKSEGVLKPVSEDLKSEISIVCRLARETLGDHPKVDWAVLESDYDKIRDLISQTIPGFEDYRHRVRIPGGFYLPNATRTRNFLTHTSKANFNVADADIPVLADHELLMMTIRSHDQFNTTIYGLDDRYRGIQNERRIILMNPHDIEDHQLKKLDQVNLINRDEDKERIARNFLVIPYEIPRQCCATYFPETNVLVPINSTAKKSNTPTSKSVIIEVQKASQNPAKF